MLDISTDYLIFDNKETITLENKGDSPVTINNCVRRRSIMDIVENGQTITFAADMRFIVFKAEAGATKPRTNAIVTDNTGKGYAVDRIYDDALRSRWILDCTSLSSENSN